MTSQDQWINIYSVISAYHILTNSYLLHVMQNQSTDFFNTWHQVCTGKIALCILFSLFLTPDLGQQTDCDVIDFTVQLQLLITLAAYRPLIKVK